MTESSPVWVIAETEQITEEIEIEGRRGGEDIGGGFGPPREAVEAVRRLATRKRVPLDAQALRTQMDGLMSVVGDMFQQAEAQTGMKLETVELSVEINAEGQVSLVGNGGKLGNTGGITLKFTRP
ncbi:MAG: hypothetical protein F6K04_01070 [Leptolyngbya sp. SIO4C5]|nr:hypothetical protein [Leptolyngbya sp. SIO4C5]